MKIITLETESQVLKVMDNRKCDFCSSDNVKCVDGRMITVWANNGWFGSESSQTPASICKDCVTQIYQQWT